MRVASQTLRALACVVVVLLSIAPASASAKTRVVRWSPFASDGSLRKGLVAMPRYRGDCWTGSFAVHRAYRCLTGHFIYDPCFADPRRDDAVVCVRDPFSRGVVRLRVSGNLQNSYSARIGTTWALRLFSGHRCSLAAGGATNVDVAGRRLNYFCRGSNLVLWGNPIRRGPTWRIRSSHSVYPGPERLSAIRVVYMGRG